MTPGMGGFQRHYSPRPLRLSLKLPLDLYITRLDQLEVRSGSSETSTITSTGTALMAKKCPILALLPAGKPGQVRLLPLPGHHKQRKHTLPYIYHTLGRKQDTVISGAARGQAELQCIIRPVSSLVTALASGLTFQIQTLNKGGNIF